MYKGLRIDSFLAPLYKSVRSYCCHSDVTIGVSLGVGVGVTSGQGELSCKQTGLVGTNWLFREANKANRKSLKLSPFEKWQKKKT